MEDYKKMLGKALETGNKRLYYIMRLLASSGIRVGELAYITVESLFTGICSVVNKGRAREIFIPNSICCLLLEYCNSVGIKKGIVFHSKKNPDKMMDKSYLWRQLDKISCLLNFPKGYVHAHSFRHFFAKEYIGTYKDVCELADILGHSSIETTRIYTRTTMSEKKERIEALGL
ncbi:tyrosine-type recombinase/integrase [Treponema sp.]|uniref:tyrosine-type recombinase/integrase n=1 Tax=Treponema sp. TaxID=166 RepID=UPI003F0ED041